MALSDIIKKQTDEKVVNELFQPVDKPTGISTYKPISSMPDKMTMPTLSTSQYQSEVSKLTTPTMKERLTGGQLKTEKLEPSFTLRSPEEIKPAETSFLEKITDPWTDIGEPIVSGAKTIGTAIGQVPQVIKQQRESKAEWEDKPLVEQYKVWGYDITDKVKDYKDGIPVGESGKRLVYSDKPGTNIPSIDDPEWETYQASLPYFTANKRAGLYGFMGGATLGTDVLDKLTTGETKLQEKLGQLSPEYEQFRQEEQAPLAKPGEVTTKPGSMMLGNLFGNFAKYGAAYMTLGSAIGSAAGGAIAKSTTLSNLSPFVKSMAVEGLKDLAISTPLSVVEAKAQGLEGKEFRDFVVREMAMDAVFNAVMFGVVGADDSIKQTFKQVADEPDVKRLVDNVERVAERKATVQSIVGEAEAKVGKEAMSSPENALAKLEMRTGKAYGDIISALVKSEKTGTDATDDIIKALANYEDVAKNVAVDSDALIDNLTLLQSAIVKNADTSTETSRKMLDKVYSKIDDMGTRLSDITEEAQFKQILSRKPKQGIQVGIEPVEPKTPQVILDKLQAAIVDDNIAIKRVSEKAHQLALNANRSHETVKVLAMNRFADMDGNAVGKGLRQIMGDIDDKMLPDLYEYVLHKLNISRAKRGKRVFNDFSAEQSAVKIKAMDQVSDVFKKTQAELVEYFDNIRQHWLVSSGLISEETALALKTADPDYVHSSILNQIWESDSSVKAGFVNTGTTIKEAIGSNKKRNDIIADTLSYTSDVVSTARRNRVGQAILEKLRKVGGEVKGYAEIVSPEKNVVKQINQAVEGGNMELAYRLLNENNLGKLSNKGAVVYVLEKGKPVAIRINNRELYRALTTQIASGENAQRVANYGRTATNWFKQPITQKNPLFSFTNFPKDLQMALVFGDEAKLTKLPKQYADAIGDIVKGSDDYLRYQALGGPGSNLVTANAKRVTPKDVLTKPNKAMKLLNSFEDFNSLVETIPRFVEFKNVLNSTGNVDRALRAAAEVTVDFSRGGWLAKLAGNFIPYFNASVQGIDKVVRDIFLKGPKNMLKRGGRGLFYLSAPTVGLYMLNKGNPHYQMIDDRVKDQYYHLPNVFGERDKNGYYQDFLRIPKSREVGILFGALFERAIRLARGEEEAMEGFGKEFASEFTPPGATLLEPIQRLMFSGKEARDWAGRPVIPYSVRGRSPKYQYDEKTTRLAIQLGNLLNVSPEFVDYTIDSYTGVIGDLYLASFTPGSDPVDLINRKFITNPLYSNEIISDFYENAEEIGHMAEDYNFTQNVPSSVVTGYESIRGVMSRYKRDISEINDVIRNIQFKESDLTPKEKEDAIKGLRQQIVSIAYEANNYYEEVSEDIERSKEMQRKSFMEPTQEDNNDILGTIINP